MVDTYTQGKLGLIEPARGSYVDTWDEPLYANWQTLEAAISGTTTLNLTSSNVVLTVPTFPAYPDPPTVSTSAQNLRLLLTGAPSVNLIVYIPATIAGFWIIDNQTTGSTTITVKTTAGGSTGITPRRGYSTTVFCDGTNVNYADYGAIIDGISTIQTVPAGAILSFGMTSAPSGWLICNGAAISRTTYANLYAAIGNTWGAGDGSTTFNIPNLVDMFLRGSGSSAVGVYEADDFKSHTHTATVTDPGHFHTTPMRPLNSAIGVSGGAVEGGGSTNTSTATTGISITNATTGGTETRPKNWRVLYCIKT